MRKLLGDRCGAEARWLEAPDGRPLCDRCAAVIRSSLKTMDTVLTMKRGRPFTNAEINAMIRPIQ